MTQLRTLNPSLLFVFWGFFTAGVIIFLVFGGQEADAINEIKGYVSEAKAKPPVEVITEVIEEVKRLVTPSFPPQISQNNTMIIGIQLSKTCYQMHKYNLTTNCPTYKDLFQFDNTIPYISGIFNTTDGVYQRQFSNFKNHCNYYLPDFFRLMIVVDPDGCWFQHKGIKTITIQAIKPENMIYKLTADSEVQHILRDLQNDEREFLTDKNENDKEVDSLEINIENQERLIRNYKDQIRDLKDDEPRFKLTNLNRQLNQAIKRLGDFEEDLKEEEAELSSVTSKLANTRSELMSVKTTSGSGLVVNGTTNLGIGRSVKECRYATVGSDIQLITDTLNYMISKCKDTTFDSRKTTIIEQTPINIMDHKFYQFMKWQKDAMERCKVKC